MTSADDDELLGLLGDVVFWGERLAAHLDGVDEHQFSDNQLKCDAACWCIMCIGEASARIRRFRPEITERYPSLELIGAHSMRNRLAHGYDSLDTGILWRTAKISVPGLVDTALAAIDDVRS